MFRMVKDRNRLSPSVLCARDVRAGGRAAGEGCALAALPSGRERVLFYEYVASVFLHNKEGKENLDVCIL